MQSGLRQSAPGASGGLSAAEFEFVRTIVLERSGIALDASRKYLADSRLGPLARQLGMPNVSELIRTCRKTPRSPTTGQLVEAMTTNETSFFRDLHPFDAMREKILPELGAKSKAINIWCAACSTGQEPYSLAMLLHEHFPALVAGGTKIMATDLSEQVVKRARAGRYSQLEVNRGLAATMLVRYFRRRGREWLLGKKILDLVEFQTSNLLRPAHFGRRFDIVFLRNVLIYFKEDVKRQVLTHIKRSMKPGAYLFMGGAETLIGIDDDFQTIRIGRTICYQLKR